VLARGGSGSRELVMRIMIAIAFFAVACAFLWQARTAIRDNHKPERWSPMDPWIIHGLVGWAAIGAGLMVLFGT
jgi:hypothetical protein